MEGVNLKPKVDHYLDLRGAIPPISLLKVTQVFREMRPNEILEILGRDPDTRIDIFKILPDFAYDLIIMEEMERDASYRVQMKKRTDIRNR
jgi:TusA-related sulfurtransferase